MSTTPTTLRSLEPASMRPGPTVREGDASARVNRIQWLASMRPGPTVREGGVVQAEGQDGADGFNEARTNGPGRYGRLGTADCRVCGFNEARTNGPGRSRS